MIAINKRTLVSLVRELTEANKPSCFAITADEQGNAMHHIVILPSKFATNRLAGFIGDMDCIDVVSDDFEKV